MVMDSAVYQIQVDGTTPSEWTSLLERFEDAHIYQTWSYGAIRWGEKNLSHLILKNGNEVVAIAQVRLIRPRFFRGGIAYLRWGPICQLRGQELSKETVHRMAEALSEEYVQRRGLFLRVLPDAFGDTPRGKIFQEAFSHSKYSSGSTANLERTFLLDLGFPLGELRKKLDQKWRNQLNRAEKNELTIVEGTGLAEYRIFAEIYQRMWNRKKFKTTVDIGEFGRLCEALPQVHQFKIFICQHKGVPVASIVCSAIGDTGIYLLGATDDDGNNTKGAYLLQWSAITWLKENGFRYYDLGGIDPESNPGVFHFKRGFSGRDVTRIAPFESCQNTLSSLCMRAADIARIGVGRSIKEWRNSKVDGSVANV
jgi:lipid II:glycine glycyltransferase (peptidoglycan interpeptide bridge formation enzyme)